MLRGSCWQATSLVPTLPGSALHHMRSQGCPPGLGGWSFQKPLEPGSREEMAPPPKLLPDPTVGQSCAQPAGLQAAGRTPPGWRVAPDTYPALAIAVPSADDGPRLLDHLQDRPSVDVAGHVGVVWAHDPRQRGEKRQVRPLDRTALATATTPGEDGILQRAQWLSEKKALPRVCSGRGAH